MRYTQLIHHRCRHFSDLEIPQSHTTRIPWWAPIPLALAVIVLWFLGVL